MQHHNLYIVLANQIVNLAKNHTTHFNYKRQFLLK